MRYETFQFIMNNRRELLFNDAAGTGNDTSTDATAGLVNPNDFLSPIVGRGGFKSFLVIVVLILVIFLLIKKLI